MEISEYALIFVPTEYKDFKWCYQPYLHGFDCLFKSI